MTTTEEAPVKDTKPDETEILEPKAETVYIEFGPEGDRLKYAQKPLSFFGKMELFSILGNAIEKAMNEGNLSVAEILEGPGARNLSILSGSELREADLIVKAVATIATHAPEFLKDLYCVALAIPRAEREYAKLLMDAPEDEGGLSDDQGIQIVDTFIDQNWEAMFDFFDKKIKPLGTKVLNKAQNTQPSKPLSPTQRRTRKQ